MRELYTKGYTVRLLLEASIVDDDPTDETRYYKMDALIQSDQVARACTFSYKDKSKKVHTVKTGVGIQSLDTSESLTSDQSASIQFLGSAEIAKELRLRVRAMDRMRIEISDGGEWHIGFDGFVNAESMKDTSTNDRISVGFTVSANGLWKFLTQSWFNWQGAVQPGYDVMMTKAGQNLYKELAKHATSPAQTLVQMFLETALSLVKLKTSEGLVQPGRFFEFGTGDEWKSAFDLAYPMPVTTLTSYSGPLSGIISQLAQSDIHECFATYRKAGDRWKPTIIFRPRPYPGVEGDDAGWLALKVHKLKKGPVGRQIMANRNDGQHPNAFHWASSSASDSGFTDYEMKIMHGFMIDERSINRFGYAARPVASNLPPLSNVPTDKRTNYVDTIQKLMERIAYQEAPSPELWTRTIQVTMTPGIHPGDVVEDWSMGDPWTGYVSTVSHRITADPWGCSTSLGVVRSIQCEAKDYPKRIRALVSIVKKVYTATNNSGAKSSSEVKSAQRGAPDSPCSPPVAGVPYGTGILKSAKAYSVPPWVLAHVICIESSFNTNPGPPSKGGIAQFEAPTANGLNGMGYGIPFSFDIAKSDPCASLDAAAWYLDWCKKNVIANGFDIADTTNYELMLWCWAVRSYNQGPTDAVADGKANGWVFSSTARLIHQYGVYWGNGAMSQARAAYGSLR